MSTEAKRRTVAIGLVLFALWPLAHRVLVLRYDISPWRFFGWAMYCEPKLGLDVGTSVLRAGVLIPLDEATSDLGVLRQYRGEYARRREMWGDLLPPDDLARRILETLPDAQSVRIVVRRLVLRPATAHIEVREQTYFYPRPDALHGLFP